MKPFDMGRLAYDRAPRFPLDAEGRLHVTAPISKACINPYLGRELPHFQALGLDGDRQYLMLRDPGELERAASTFNNLPALSTHFHANAANHRPDLVIGSTGTDAKFEFPYLNNSLVVWSADDIESIQDGTKAEISCAYQFAADMRPGIWQGQSYDGVMRDLNGSHVAIVVEGRAGPDVRIGGPAALASDARLLTAAQEFKQMFPSASSIRCL